MDPCQLEFGFRPSRRRRRRSPPSLRRLVQRASLVCTAIRVCHSLIRSRLDLCLWSSRTLACPPVIIPTHMFMLLASGRLVSPHLISRYPSPSLSYSAVHTLPSLCMHASFSPARSSPLCRSSRHPIYLDISFSRQASKASGGEHSRAIYDLGHQQNGKSRRRRRARRISPFEDVCGDPESPRRRGRRRKREAGSSRQTRPLQALAGHVRVI